MSVERRCACGKLEEIRFNFGDDYEAEAAFHAKPYTCPECFQNEQWIKQLETMDLGDLVNTLDKAINKLKNK